MSAEWDETPMPLTSSEARSGWDRDDYYVAEFETFVHAQKPADEPWTPTAAAPYDFKSRKQIEGIHPQLILDVFHPKRLLDVGCGPSGHLRGCWTNSSRHGVVYL